MDYAAKLEQLSVIAIRGEDSQEFLSNQFTSDITSIQDGEIRQSAWCDPKGRVLFTPLVFKSGDAYGCLIANELSENFHRRLSMFVLRAKVTIEQVDNDGVWGLQLDNIDRPIEVLNAANEFGLSPLKFLNNGLDLNNSARYYLIGNVDSLERFFAETALPRDDERWYIDQIKLGIPEVTTELSGEFLPQHLNLDALNAVSFQKGCYPGQEIIARLKYRGKVKQRLYRLVPSGSTPRSACIELLSNVFATTDPEKKIGQIVSARADTSNSYALAVLDVEVANKPDGAVRIANVDGHFSIAPPAYQIPD